LITRIGTTQRPSPQQARQFLNEVAVPQAVVVTIERNGRTVVLALEQTK
jgi:hypothetical protein